VRQDAEHRKATPLGDGIKKALPGPFLFPEFATQTPHLMLLGESNRSTSATMSRR